MIKVVRSTATSVKAKLCDHVTRVEHKGEIIIITRHGKDAAAIIPMNMLMVEKAQ